MSLQSLSAKNLAKTQACIFASRQFFQASRQIGLDHFVRARVTFEAVD
jgi:hypothetical protein